MPNTTLLAIKDHYFTFKGDTVKCVTEGNMYIIVYEDKHETVIKDDEGEDLSLNKDEMKNLFGGLY